MSVFFTRPRARAARLMVAFPAVLFLSTCASLPAPSGADSAMIVGRLTLEASGTGTAANGADGTINTKLGLGTALTIANTESGATYELRTLAPSGTFTLADAVPGRYRIVSFWAQVETANAWITARTTFDTSPTFDVQPGSVANLGDIRWRFTWDLARPSATGSYSFGTGYDAVALAFGRAAAGSGWQNAPVDRAAVTGDASAVSSVYALPPKGNGFDKLLFP